QVSHANFKVAITDARNLSAKVVKDGVPKWDTLPGVDDYFLNPPLRNAACEKVSEEAIALIALIDEKTATNAKLAQKFAPLKANLQKFYFNPKTLHVDAKKLEKELDPARGVADVTKLFQKLQQFQKEKEDAAASMRELWLHDQSKRFQQEVAEGRGEKSKLMAKNLGEAQFLEMAQMAETLAKNKHGLKLNLFGPEHDPAILIAPMTLAEIASLYGYSTQDFTTLNGILRGTRANPADEAKASSADAGTKPVPAPPVKSKDGKPLRACDIPAPHIDYTPYVESCKSALTKLPVFKGKKVFRADKDLPDFLIEEIIENGTMTQKSFVSCGLQKVPGFGEWVSEISGVQTGREITMFSLHSTEGEVLFPPGSVFRFKGCKIDGVPYGNHKDLRNILTTKTKKVDFEFTQQS
ncbi:MAG TPA: hypothetical protein VK968_10490, partial [Roseimicrobium sp.]|nr:hypothetical protein [Roseimicrobium sp.]